MWVFDKESTPGKFLKRNERKFNKIAAIGQLPQARDAMGAIAEQVTRVLEGEKDKEGANWAEAGMKKLKKKSKLIFVKFKMQKKSLG